MAKEPVKKPSTSPNPKPKADLPREQTDAARAVLSLEAFTQDSVAEALRGSDKELTDRKADSTAKRIIEQWEEDGVIVPAGDGKWKRR